MELSTVLKQLIKTDACFPALKLAWDCHIEPRDIGSIPKMTPSDYMKEIQLTTEARHALLCRQHRKLDPWKFGCDIIIPTPSIIVFQNYTPGKQYSFNVTLKNVSKQSKKVALKLEQSHTFYLDSQTLRVAKVAPGINLNITIHFRPHDDGDYFSKLFVHHAEGAFTIPIQGIGSRGILDLPDVIEFDKVPVKFVKTLPITICNVGSKVSEFTMSIESPFCVSPETGCMQPNEIATFYVSFCTETPNWYEGELLVKNRNGEEIYCHVTAEGILAPVKLSVCHVYFEDTCIGLRTKKTFKIFNDNEIPIEFQWKKHLHTIPQDRSHSLPEGQEFLQHVDLPIYSTDMESIFTHENFLFEPSVGTVHPHSSLEIMAFFSPLSSKTYSADAFLDITGQTSRVKLNLCGTGIGPQFQFAFEELNIGTVFLGGSYTYEIPVVNITEIRGKIQCHGIVPNVSSGAKVQIEPEEMDLAPEENAAFYVNVECPARPGEFNEELKFEVVESKKHYYVQIKGSVTYPRLHFSIPELLFGDVSIGFPVKEEFLVTNDSLNYVNVNLRIDDDGIDDPIDSVKILELFQENGRISDNPREFTVQPQEFTLSPRGCQRLSVTICANSCRSILRQLLCYIVFDNDPIGDLTHSLPIVANCVIPCLSAEPSLVTMDNCLFQFPCEAELSVRNLSKLPCCYCIVPMKGKNANVVSDNFVGVINPKSVTRIPFKLTSYIRSETETTMELYAMGSDTKVLTFTVHANCRSTVLKANPPSVDFGTVNCLTPTDASVDLVNNSSTTVRISAALISPQGKNGESWECEFDKDEIPPFGTKTIALNVVLKERGLHTNVLRVKVADTQATFDIPVKAFGNGCSILFFPDIEDEIAFGSLFVKEKKVIEFEVTNVGHLPKVLEWRLDKDGPPENQFLKKEGKKYSGKVKDVQNQTTKKSKNQPSRSTLSRVLLPMVNRLNTKSKSKPKPQSKSKPKPQSQSQTIKTSNQSVFTVSPQKKTLEPNSSMKISFTAKSNTPKLTSQNQVLWTYTPFKQSPTVSPLKRTTATTSGRRKLEETPYKEAYLPFPAKAVKLSLDANSQSLEFSKQSIDFLTEVTPLTESLINDEIIKITNNGNLPITGTLTVKSPFSIVHDNVPVSSWTHTFEPREDGSLDRKNVVGVTIRFDGDSVGQARKDIELHSKLNVAYENSGHTSEIPINVKMLFPSVLLNKSEIDFGLITNDKEEMQNFEMVNPHVFCLSYKWYIRPWATFINHTENLEDDDDYESLGGKEEIQESPVQTPEDLKGSEPEVYLDEDDLLKEITDVETRQSKDESEGHVAEADFPLRMEDIDEIVNNALASEIEGESEEPDVEETEPHESSTAETSMEDVEHEAAVEAGVTNTKDETELTVTENNDKDQNEESERPETKSDSPKGLDPIPEEESLVTIPKEDSFTIVDCMDSKDFIQDEMETSKDDYESDYEGDSIHSTDEEYSMKQMLYRSIFMQGLGIEDPDAEFHELNPLNHLKLDTEESTGLVIDGVDMNEMISIAPMAGVILAGQAQEFTVSFNGTRNIDFRTVLICVVDGGTNKSIVVTGRSSKDPRCKKINKSV